MLDQVAVCKIQEAEPKALLFENESQPVYIPYYWGYKIWLRVNKTVCTIEGISAEGAFRPPSCLDSRVLKVKCALSTIACPVELKRQTMD